MAGKGGLGEGGDGIIPLPVCIGIQGQEGQGNSLLIAGRPSMVLGVRLRVFQRKIDGWYREKRKATTKT